MLARNWAWTGSWKLTSEHYYGPTTLGALREFVRLGEIDGETIVINACDGARRQVHEMSDLWEAVRSEADENQFQIQLGDPVGPAVSKMSIRLQERIRDLEQMLARRTARARRKPAALQRAGAKIPRSFTARSFLTRDPFVRPAIAPLPVPRLLTSQFPPAALLPRRRRLQQTLPA